MTPTLSTILVYNINRTKRYIVFKNLNRKMEVRVEKEDNIYLIPHNISVFVRVPPHTILVFV